MKDRKVLSDEIMLNQCRSDGGTALLPSQKESPLPPAFSHLSSAQYEAILRAVEWLYKQQALRSGPVSVQYDSEKCLKARRCIRRRP